MIDGAPRGACSPTEDRQAAEFFSFMGTNDLTQMTDGPQPRRRRALLPDYVDQKSKAGIFKDDPFQSLGPARRGQAR